MCRVLTYLGKSVLLDDMLYQPDNSLIRQSYDPKLMKHIQNLAGFGMTVWHDHFQDAHRPLYYRRDVPPFFDRNLKNLAKQLHAHCFMAHIRGVAYHQNEIVSEQNAHPFLYRGCPIAMAHNGNIVGINDIKRRLLPHIRSDITEMIEGTTDSEWIYATLLSQLDSPFSTEIGVEETKAAVVKTLRIFREARYQERIHHPSPANLFISNGKFLIATRFVFDYGRPSDKTPLPFLEYHSLWYTYGEEYGLFDGVYKMRRPNKRCVSFASEPLATNTAAWIEVCEYTLLTAHYEKKQLKIRNHNLDM